MATTTAHHHGSSGTDRDQPVSPRVRRLLVLATLPFVVLTLAGLAAFWPSGHRTSASLGVDFPSGFVRARVVTSEPAPCPGAGDADRGCRLVRLRLRSGPDTGKLVSLLDTTMTRKVAAGDRVVLSVSPDAPPDLRYDIADYERRAPLLLLGLLFAGVVVALGRWRGALALAGLVVSLVVLIAFVLPSILSGNPPVPVALTGSSLVMLLALYLAHGLNARTTSAVLGTFVSLSLVAILAVVFVQVTRLSGLASEEALFVNVANARINLEGLLLAGIVIGSLGVLDDVTVTQASAVWELHLANPALGARELYRSGLRIGRDHIASAVNTLVFAYAGASLPLLILFTISRSHFGDVVNGEIVAEEVVRTLVGSVGLVASVPVTTVIAAAVASGDRAPRRAAARADRAGPAPVSAARDRALPEEPATPHHEPAPAAGRSGRRRRQDPDEDDFWRRDDV
jgi:uncharacterized membrane protein